LGGGIALGHFQTYLTQRTSSITESKKSEIRDGPAKAEEGEGRGKRAEGSGDKKRGKTHTI